jgi:hypothetical protein
LNTDAEIIREELRTPRAAAIAGVVFSLLLGTSLVLVRISVPADPTDAREWLANSGRRHAVLVAVNLVPFAGIAFLWFIGVIRDRLGDREDRFFATVFLGSGLLFVAMMFGAAAVTGSLLTGFSGGVHASADSSQTWRFGGSLAHGLLTTYGMRMAAVFMISAATITLRYAVIPRWLGIAGYASALALLLGVNAVGWLELLFPLWVLLVSIHLLLESFRGQGAVIPRAPAG